MLCLVVGICYSIKCYFPAYYEQSSIGLVPLPMFYVGFLFGDLSQSKKGQNTFLMLGLFFVLAVLYFIDVPVYGIEFILQRLFGILLVCLTFQFMMACQAKFLLTIFNWLGKYTFELYILHLYYWFVIKGVCHYGSMFNITVAVLLSLVTCVPMHWMIGKVVSQFKLK
mgnify:CR=1 FL=1